MVISIPVILLTDMNKEIIAILTVSKMIMIMAGGSSFLVIAKGQAQTTNNNNNNNITRTAGSATNKPLPVLLIHGYASDASVSNTNTISITVSGIRPIIRSWECKIEGWSRSWKCGCCRRRYYHNYK
jgi:hypothetical protein